MIYKILPFHVVEDIIRDFVERKHVPAMINEVPVNVEWDYYREISKAGAGFVVVAMDDNGLCGISGYQVTKNPNNQDEVEASNVIWSIDKEKSIKAKDFLKEANGLLKGMGVHKVSFTLCNEKIGRFLSMNGFSKEATVYGVEL